MGDNDAEQNESLHTAGIIRSRWPLFVLLGLVMMMAGVLSIVLPARSDIPAGQVLGTVLCLAGIVQIVQATKVINWPGFMWHLLLGLVAAIGGALIYIDSLYGVVAITILIAVIFAILGVSQIAFAVKVRHMAAWYWFVIAGAVSLVVSALLLSKLPYSAVFTPATVASASLLVTGWAYVALALASWKKAS